MKKTALTILLTVIVSAAHAQVAYDAWRFSQNNYEGTARSVAMGNAFTALGGDLGAVSINPASSAVAGYSQLTLTPSITISSTTTGGVLPPGGSVLTYFDKEYKSNYTRAGIPNIGFTFDFNTGRKSGLKSFTVGFIMNRTNSWCEDVYAAGTNRTTSFAAALADKATSTIAEYNQDKDPSQTVDFSADDYLMDDAYEYMPWDETIGYRSGMISAYGNEGKKFIGATEILYDNGNINQEGELYQTYGRSVYGNKYEYLFNIGTNISDFIYIGFNLGINSLTYDETSYFKEAAVDEGDFKNEFSDGAYTYFRNLTYKSSYSASGTGIFGKLGIIITPGYGLRFGASIQTPTSTTIREEWRESGSTTFSDSKYDGNETSPLGQDEYSFNSPFRASFGVAYTLGRFAVISADYEVADYSGMKYMIDHNNMSERRILHFETVNDDIRQAYGAAHQFRIGAEVKPLSTLAVRAGYNLLTSAQKKAYDGDSEEYYDIDPTYAHSLSFGLGYISRKSFFADLACRHSFATTESYCPYDTYQYDGNGNVLNYSPEIFIRSSNWKVLLTLGWRF